MKKITLITCLVSLFTLVHAQQKEIVKEYKVEYNNELSDSILTVRIENYLQDTLDFGIKSDSIPIITDCIEVDSIEKEVKLFWFIKIRDVNEIVNMAHELNINREESSTIKLISFVCFTEEQTENDNIIKKRAKAHAKEIKENLEKYLQ